MKREITDSIGENLTKLDLESEYFPNLIFPQIYFIEIHVTKLSIVLIFIFPIPYES